MTAEQRKKLIRLQELLTSLETFDTGPNYDINEGRSILLGLLAESGHNPFEDHWKGDR